MQKALNSRILSWQDAQPNFSTIYPSLLPDHLRGVKAYPIWHLQSRRCLIGLYPIPQGKDLTSFSVFGKYPLFIWGYPSACLTLDYTPLKTKRKHCLPVTASFTTTPDSHPTLAHLVHKTSKNPSTWREANATERSQLAPRSFTATLTEGSHTPISQTRKSRLKDAQCYPQATP